MPIRRRSMGEAQRQQRNVNPTSDVAVLQR
jgi:hypothetical protein